MKNLRKVSTEDLKAEMSRRGYAVDSLWCLEDIDGAIENYEDKGKSKLKRLSKKSRLELLNNIISGQGVMIAVNDTISDELYTIATGQEWED